MEEKITKYFIVYTHMWMLLRELNQERFNGWTYNLNSEETSWKLEVQNKDEFIIFKGI
jgi:hypothetical protein